MTTNAIFDATAAAGVLLGILEDTIPLTFNEMVERFGPEVDPFFRMQVTSDGVRSGGKEQSRDLVVRKLFTSGLSGNRQMAQSAATAGTGVIDLPGGLYGQGRKWSDVTSQDARNAWTYEGVTLQQYPDPTVGANQKLFEMDIGLNMELYNIMFTMDDFRFDDLPFTIQKIVRPKLEGWARHILRGQAIMWYTLDTDKFSVSGVNTSIAGGADGDNYWDFEPDAPCNKYEQGMLVDVVVEHATNGAAFLNSTDFTAGTGGEPHADNASLANRITCMVDYVDPYYGSNGLVRLRLVGDGNTSAGAGNTWGGSTNNPAGKFAATPTMVKIYLYQSRGHAFAGLNSWLKSSGYLLGNSASRINVDQFPEFKSPAYAASGPATEQKFRKIISRFHTAQRALHASSQQTRIDTILTTPGVFNAFAAQKAPKEIIDRMGVLNLTREGTSEEIVFTHDGVTVRTRLSDWISPGYAYFLETRGNNWKKYGAPNTYSQTSRNSDMPAIAPIEFVGKFVPGSRGIFLPIINTAGSVGTVTRGIQAPAECRMQWCPEKVPGIVSSGWTEDNATFA